MKKARVNGNHTKNFKMPKGGKRTPQGGRPLGSTKTDKRDVKKGIRFTKTEYQSILDAIKIYGGKESSFFRDCILGKVKEIIEKLKT